MRATLLFLLFITNCTSALLASDRVIKSNDFSPVMRELMFIQEQKLSATIPRPFGAAVTNHSEEIIRRMGIVVDTWEDYQRGLSEAKKEISKGNIYLKGLMPLNQVELKYIKILSLKYKCGFEQVSSTLTNSHDIVYVYGFNSLMGKNLLSQHEKHCFGYDIGKAVRAVYGNNFESSYFSAFFIPWRFSMPMENIKGRLKKGKSGASITRHIGPTRQISP